MILNFQNKVNTERRSSYTEGAGIFLPKANTAPSGGNKTDTVLQLVPSSADIKGSPDRAVGKAEITHEDLKSDLQKNGQGDAKKDKPKKALIKEVPHFIDDKGVLYEIVGNDFETKFACFKEGDFQLVDEIKQSKCIISPSVLEGIDLDDLRLPSFPVEYVSGELLWGEIQKFICRYLCLDEDGVNVVSSYVLLTWVYERLSVLPYLRARGDTGSGKSRFLQTIGSICCRPLFLTAAVGSAPLFRLINKFSPTLILDEADFNNSDTKNDIIKILNTGFEEGSKIMRCDGDAHAVKSFKVFGPKVFGARFKALDTAFENRCITFDMEGFYKKGSVPFDLKETAFKEEALQLRNKLLAWKLKNFHTISFEVDSNLDHLDPRLVQIVRPLLAVASSEKIKQSILDKIRSLQNHINEERSDSLYAEIFEAILKTRGKGSAQVPLKDVFATFRENSPDSKEGPADTRRLGRIIRDTLKLVVKKQSGMSRVFCDEEKFQKLSEKYGLDLGNPPTPDPDGLP